MYFLELAAQGVKGCSPSTRAALKPGYVVLRPPSADPFPLSGLFLELLFAEGRGQEVGLAGPGGGKAALTLQSSDLSIYRVVRELGGSSALQRLDRAAQRFEKLSSDAGETAQFLRAQAGLPSRVQFEQLFTLQAGHFPSKNPKPTPAPATSSAPAVPAAGPDDARRAEASLKELQRELELSKAIDQLQFKVDGLSSQLFGLESTLRSTEELRSRLAEATAAFEAAPTPESSGLQADILQRIERYPALVQKRDEALARLEQERESSNPESARVSRMEPLYRDVRFLAGAGLGVACLAGGVALEGIFKYVALLDIPAFGFAGLVALRWIDDYQGTRRTHWKGDFLATRQKKIEDEFEAEAQQVRRAVQVLHVESPGEVAEVFGRRAALGERVEALRQALVQAESDPAWIRARSEYDALQRESDRLNQELREKSGSWFRDAREVERDLERVRESIAQARASAMAGPAPSPTGDLGAERFEDPTPALLAHAASLLQSDVASLAAQVQDRCGSHLGALCDQRYAAVELDATGRAVLVTPRGKVSVGALPAADVDLYFLSLRMALLERLCPRSKFPLLLEDCLGPVEASRIPLLGRMLKQLGSVTQVIHVSAHPDFGGMADASATL